MNPPVREYTFNPLSANRGEVQTVGDAAFFSTLLDLRERLAADAPGVSEYRADLAGSHYSLGQLLAFAGDRAGAERSHRAALALQEKLAADAPGVPGYHVSLAGC